MTTSCCNDAKNAVLGIFALGTHRIEVVLHGSGVSLDLEMLQHSAAD